MKTMPNKQPPRNTFSTYSRTASTDTSLTTATGIDKLQERRFPVVTHLFMEEFKEKALLFAAIKLFCNDGSEH